jgi:hypothetical protein
MPTATIVKVWRAGYPAVKGVMEEVAGYRLRVSVLNRKDRALAEDSGLEVGKDVELIFHSDKRSPTPAIRGCLKSASRGRASTLLDIEVADWDKLAGYWQTAGHKEGRLPSGT